jgi:hypothetical protein
MLTNCQALIFLSKTAAKRASYLFIFNLNQEILKSFGKKFFIRFSRFSSRILYDGSEKRVFGMGERSRRKFVFSGTG